MSEPDEKDPLDGGETADAEGSDLSDRGVGLSVGEPNTFEPEEAGSAPEPPAE
jgi:hypothetical protein